MELELQLSHYFWEIYEPVGSLHIQGNVVELIFAFVLSFFSYRQARVSIHSTFEDNTRLQFEVIISTAIRI